MKKLFIIFIALFISNAYAYITENIVNGCNLSTSFTPVFQINTYTCDSGYFLPADTLGCQPCPTGHTCSGGTFEYNPTIAQGITFTKPVKSNVANGCSVNFGRFLRPVFQPNTVALTYDDGVGNTSSGTCTYDGLISLPEPPTRPGYTFTGWKSQTNNEQ